jgi:hypothetical protein
VNLIKSQTKQECFSPKNWTAENQKTYEAYLNRFRGGVDETIIREFKIKSLEKQLKQLKKQKNAM